MCECIGEHVHIFENEECIVDVEVCDGEWGVVDNFGGIFNFV